MQGSEFLLQIFGWPGPVYPAHSLLWLVREAQRGTSFNMFVISAAVRLRYNTRDDLQKPVLAVRGWCRIFLE
jgi:hypothetical protein